MWFADAGLAADQPMEAPRAVVSAAFAEGQENELSPLLSVRLRFLQLTIHRIRTRSEATFGGAKKRR